MKEDRTHSIKPPGVFLVPFTLLTLPFYVLGTLWAFIEIGWRSGNSGVFRIYFAKAEAEWRKQQEEQRKEEAEKMAELIRDELINHIDKEVDK